MMFMLFIFTIYKSKPFLSSTNCRIAILKSSYVVVSFFCSFPLLWLYLIKKYSQK